MNGSASAPVYQGQVLGRNLVTHLGTIASPKKRQSV